MSQYPLLIVCLLLQRDGREGLKQHGRRPSLSSVAIPSNRACASEPNTNFQGGCSSCTHIKNHDKGEYTRDGDEEKNKNPRNAFFTQPTKQFFAVTKPTILTTNAVVLPAI
jgi:hypothetical protein